MAATGVCNHLCFGSECGELEPLRTLADLLLHEPPELSSAVQQALRDGLAGGAAWSRAISRYLEEQGTAAPLSGEAAAAVLSGANNWLGIEYLKAIAIHLDGRMKATAFLREGSAYGDDLFSAKPAASSRRDPAEYKKTLPSALALRTLFRKYAAGDRTAALVQALIAGTPATSAGELLAARRNGSLLLPGAAGTCAYTRLLSASAEELAETDNSSAELANRLKQTVRSLAVKSRTPDAGALWDALTQQASGRNFPLTKIQRVLTALLLGIRRSDREDAQAAGPQYLRILGFDKKGRYLLRLMREHARLPVLTRQSDFLEHGHAGPAFERQAGLDRIADSFRAVLAGQNPADDFDTSVVIL